MSPELGISQGRNLWLVWCVSDLCHVLHLALTIGIQYSPSYYRATWIAIGLDAGFATAMSIRPKWLRDICSILFSIYYVVYANEADEKVRVVYRHAAVYLHQMHRSVGSEQFRRLKCSELPGKRPPTHM